MNDKMFLFFTNIFRDVGDRHYSEVQRHPGGRVSTKVIPVKCQRQSSVSDSCQMSVPRVSKKAILVKLVIS